MTKKILKSDALRPKFIRLYSGNGTYGVYIVFADQSDVPLYEGPSAVKAIHFAASAAANFEIKIQTDFQTDSLLPGELELYITRASSGQASNSSRKWRVGALASFRRIERMTAFGPEAVSGPSR
jgi:hypothetical protein